MGEGNREIGKRVPGIRRSPHQCLGYPVRPSLQNKRDADNEVVEHVSGLSQAVTDNAKESTTRELLLRSKDAVVSCRYWPCRARELGDTPGGCQVKVPT